VIVRAVSELEYVIDSMSRGKRYSIDVECVDRGFPDITLVGISVGWTHKDGAYIPVGHAKGSQLPTDLVLERLKKFIEGNPNKIAVMHNAKYDMTVLDLIGGIKFSENIFDTMVAAWLLDTENPHGLKPLAKRYLNYAMVELDEITPKERHPVTDDWVYRTDLVDIETMGKYAVDDVTKPLQLMDIFLPRLEAEGQLKIFAELEMPKVFILKDIEMTGIRIDVETLKKRMEEAPKVLEEIEKRMYALRPNGKPFNASSTKQLNQVLFDEVKIKPIGEPGKTGLYSTSKDVMEQWAGKYPIVDAILEYRQVSKLMGTYLEGLAKRIGPDGRIRTRFNQILTTGRLSSSNPNLQNIPRSDNDKFGLRDMFIAGPGKKLVVADYSQIELRVLAHISKDPTFIKAFKDNEDLHSYAAKMLFDLPEPLDEVKKLHPVERSIGKCVTGDTRVATKHGLVRIDSLSDFREQDKFTKLELPVLTKDGEQMTSYFYYGGKQKVLKVETKQGFKIAGTPNHKVLVRSGSENVWKRLDELVIGDKLVTEVGGRSPESYVRIRENLWTSTKGTGESSPIIEIDENWGRFLGYVLGDGTVAPNQGVYFVVGGRYEEDIIADIQRIGNAIGLNVGVGKKKLRGGTEGVTCLTLGSTRLIRFLDSIGFSGRKGKKFSVPECIYRSPHSVVKEFLSALFETDGWVTTSGTGGIAMCTKSKSFAQEIQLLLGWLGIRATINEQWNSTYEKYYYNVYVLKSSWHAFHDKVDFISSEKKKKLDMLCEQEESNRIVYAEVNMITEDEDEVFDFEVPDVHNFVGNGLVQHNTFNFSMVYGAGVKRLAATAKVSERRAKELKDKYMNRFHGIQRYLDTMHARAERDGYVSTIIGRRRHLKDAQLRGRSERENELKASALRQSGNSPVQGSAADILFIAMRNIRNRLIREGLTEKIKMVLQVHDELLFEVDEDIAEYAANLVKSEMETAVTLRVPLIADTAIGDRWSECK